MTKFLIIVGSLLTMFIVYYFDLIDRLGIKSNIIEINMDNEGDFFRDVTVLLKNEKDYVLSNDNLFKTVDWYGKDKLLIYTENDTVSIKFNEYKFNSWDKINCEIKTDKIEKGYVIDWCLKSTDLQNNGVDTLLF